MTVCEAKDCQKAAFMFVARDAIGLCYPHWRLLWTKTDFYDKTGWEGQPVELKDGRVLRVDTSRLGAWVPRPPYSGLQVETPAGEQP